MHGGGSRTVALTYVVVVQLTRAQADVARVTSEAQQFRERLTAATQARDEERRQRHAVVAELESTRALAAADVSKAVAEAKHLRSQLEASEAEASRAGREAMQLQAKAQEAKDAQVPTWSRSAALAPARTNLPDEPPCAVRM